MHQYLDIGSFISIPLYNILIGIGAIFGFLNLDKEIEKANIDFQIEKKIYFSLIIAIGLGIIGSKLFTLFYHGHNLSLYNFSKSGTTFMGGIIVAGLSLYFTNTIFNINNFFVFNLLVPFTLIAHTFGRLGCFFAGCCYGVQTSSILGVVFPKNSLAFKQFGEGIHIHPTQLYEATFLAILVFITLKYVVFDFRIVSYLIAYGTFRFMVEYFRADERGQLFIQILSPSQIISLLFILIGACIPSLYKLKKTKKPHECGA